MEARCEFSMKTNFWNGSSRLLCNGQGMMRVEAFVQMVTKLERASTLMQPIQLQSAIFPIGQAECFIGNCKRGILAGRSPIPFPLFTHTILSNTKCYELFFRLRVNLRFCCTSSLFLAAPSSLGASTISSLVEPSTMSLLDSVWTGVNSPPSAFFRT